MFDGGLDVVLLGSSCERTAKAVPFRMCIKSRDCAAGTQLCERSARAGRSRSEGTLREQSVRAIY
jgi:hypothetical protein